MASLVSTAPGFIANFFASSRLHHLSTWKSDLSEFVSQQMQASPSSYHSSSLLDPYRIIMHVDMDCFFASVSTRDRSDLLDKPVCIAHSIHAAATADSYSSSEIASCNYTARQHGLKNGMFLGSIKDKVPDLVILPYEFAKYDMVSRELYRILLKASDFVQAVSCDEAYIDMTYQLKKRLQGTMECGSNYPVQLERAARQLAEELRQLIRTATGCNASVGISHNLLLARLATTKAKPNGIFFLPAHQIGSLVGPLTVRDLPGIGHSISSKCTSLGVATCADILRKPLQLLQKELGDKTGQMLHAYASGQDDRVLENKPRQTLGADINWGIRFTTNEQVEAFLLDFSDEVFNRLTKAQLTACHVTVNLKKKLYEGEPMKFLGCGHCEDFSKSMQTPQAINSSKVLGKYVLALAKQINLMAADIRGVGIHLKKLQSNKPSWFTKTSAVVKKDEEPLSDVESDPEDDPESADEQALPPVVQKKAQMSIMGFTKPAADSVVGKQQQDVVDLDGEEHDPFASLDSAHVIDQWEAWPPEYIADSGMEPLLPAADSVASNHSVNSTSSTKSIITIKQPLTIHAAFQIMVASNANKAPSAPVTSSSTSSKPSTSEVIGKRPSAAPSFSSSGQNKKNKVELKKNISSFFQAAASSATISTASKDEDLLDGVDMEFWNSLPQEVRTEQLTILRQQKNSSSSSSSGGGTGRK